MASLYTQTLKYFHLAIVEFLPTLEEMKKAAPNPSVAEEIEDLIEAYRDIDSKIQVHNLNYSDPNRRHPGEADEVDIDIPDAMVENLSRLSLRLLLAWKEKLERLKKKKYLTDTNKDEIHRLENLIWPLEALSQAESYVLGKYSHLGPANFPGEIPDSGLQALLEDIHKCYALGDEELLEAKRLEETEKTTRVELQRVVDSLGDEITSLKFKKLNGGWRTVLKSGFHNRITAESRLGALEGFISELLSGKTATKGEMPNPEQASETIAKTIKSRLKTENLFVETRAQGEDQHVLIGKRDGTPEKAHVVIDGKTGEIRVEDNQQEPTELAHKIEAILTLPDGRQIRTTRELIEVLPNQVERRPRIDLADNFTVSGSGEGNFIEFQIKNNGVESALDIQVELVADGGHSTGKVDVTHNLSPEKLSGSIRYRYTETAFFQQKLENPRIVFTYSSAGGKKFTSGRRVIQDLRADGKYNIHSKPGEYFES